MTSSTRLLTRSQVRAALRAAGLPPAEINGFMLTLPAGEPAFEIALVFRALLARAASPGVDAGTIHARY